MHKILYFVLPVILVLGIYGSQTSYQISDFFKPYNVKNSNNIMTLSIDNSTYKQGQTIYFAGKVNQYDQGAKVHLQIIDPIKNTVSDFRNLLNRAGVFSGSFPIPETFSDGKYIITAYYEGDPNKKQVSLKVNISSTPKGVVYILIPTGASTEGSKINFNPKYVTVSQGTRIFWVNNDNTIHTVISGKINDNGTYDPDNLFKGGFITPGENLAASPKPGNYQYFCKIHPWLVGSLSVKANPVAAKSSANIEIVKPSSGIVTTKSKDSTETKSKTIINAAKSKAGTQPTKSNPGTDTTKSKPITQPTKSNPGTDTAKSKNSTQTTKSSPGTDTAVPLPPTGLATPFVSSSQISISWHAPLNDGGSPITGYKVESSTDGGTKWDTIAANTASKGTWYSNYHLLASTTYTYRVYSINSIGTSSPSNTVSATTKPATVSDPPTGLATPFIASSQISISWHAPLNDGGSPITGYKIESSTDSGTAWNIVAANTATTGTWYSNYHLLASTTYTYRVYSINSNGTSSPSSTVVGTTSKPFPVSDSILLSIWKNDRDLQKLYPEAADGKTENLKQWATSTGWNQDKSLSALIPSGKFPLYLDQALLSIWVERKDLQKLYPEVEQGNVTNLKKWALIQGWNEDKRLSVLVPQGKVPKY